MTQKPVPVQPEPWVSHNLQEAERKLGSDCIIPTLLFVMAANVIPGHLHAPAMFYRAVTKPQDVHLVYYNYKIGRHPQTHSYLPGNFSHKGALYVMANKEDAMFWGKYYGNLHLRGPLAVKHIPVTHLNYQKQCGNWDIIEGPITGKRRTGGD
ncbi:hypothetical protein BYT27DRAFT_7218033 [Phlegmacium glaucopus]|nr:hypothetical protein BYT27DRAFT_7218033 [Phlegmacium glaucopus]